MNKDKRELMERLNNFTDEFYNLIVSFEEYEYKTKEDINDYIIEKYPFNEDLNEILTKVIAWKWSIIDKLEGE